MADQGFRKGKAVKLPKRRPASLDAGRRQTALIQALHIGFKIGIGERQKARLAHPTRRHDIGQIPAIGVQGRGPGITHCRQHLQKSRDRIKTSRWIHANSLAFTP